MNLKKIILMAGFGIVMGSSGAAAYSIVEANGTQEQEQTTPYIVPSTITSEQFNNIISKMPADVVASSTEGVIGTPAELLQTILDENPIYIAIVQAELN